jgi:catechol 2,3-dioxygenase-like lactoylglutathione lyase family enzyme
MRLDDAIPDFVRPLDQLVSYRYVRDLARSVRFYGSLGFEIEPVGDAEARLAWEGRLLYLRELAGLPPPPADALSGARVVVHDVETYWAVAQEIQAPIVEPISDNDGVRAFTIADPDGFGVQFATPIGAARPQERTCGCGTHAFDMTEDGDNKVRFKDFANSNTA